MITPGSKTYLINQNYKAQVERLEQAERQRVETENQRIINEYIDARKKEGFISQNDNTLIKTQGNVKTIITINKATGQVSQETITTTPAQTVTKKTGKYEQIEKEIKKVQRALKSSASSDTTRALNKRLNQLYDARDNLANTGTAFYSETIPETSTTKTTQTSAGNFEVFDAKGLGYSVAPEKQSEFITNINKGYDQNVIIQSAPGVFQAPKQKNISETVDVKKDLVVNIPVKETGGVISARKQSDFADYNPSRVNKVNLMETELYQKTKSLNQPLQTIANIGIGAGAGATLRAIELKNNPAEASKVVGTGILLATVPEVFIPALIVTGAGAISLDLAESKTVQEFSYKTGAIGYDIGIISASDLTYKTISGTNVYTNKAVRTSTADTLPGALTPIERKAFFLKEYGDIPGKNTPFPTFLETSTETRFTTEQFYNKLLSEGKIKIDYKTVIDNNQNILGQAKDSYPVEITLRQDLKRGSQIYEETLKHELKHAQDFLEVKESFENPTYAFESNKEGFLIINKKPSGEVDLFGKQVIRSKTEPEVLQPKPQDKSVQVELIKPKEVIDLTSDIYGNIKINKVATIEETPKIAKEIIKTEEKTPNVIKLDTAQQKLVKTTEPTNKAGYIGIINAEGKPEFIKVIEINKLKAPKTKPTETTTTETKTFNTKNVEPKAITETITSNPKISSKYANDKGIGFKTSVGTFDEEIIIKTPRTTDEYINIKTGLGTGVIYTGLENKDITGGITRKGLTTTFPITNIKPAINNIQQPFIKTEVKNEPTIKPITETPQILNVKTSTETITIQGTQLRQLTRQQLRQEQTQQLKNIPMYKEYTQPKTKPPVETPKILFPSTNEGYKKSYVVKVRSRGTFKEVGKVATLQKAIQKGVEVTKRTASASFKVEQNNKPLRLGFIGQEYTTSKKDPFIAVQKRSFRISSLGEKFEISKKGRLVQSVRKKTRGVFI